MFADPAGRPELQGANRPPVDDDQLSQTQSGEQRGPLADASDFALHLLALGSVRGIGVRALRALIDATGGNLSRTWDEDTPTVGDWLARARVKEARQVASDIANERSRLLDDARREFEALTNDGVHIIGMHDEQFPRRLASTSDAPYWLFVQGEPKALTGSAHIAIVGTRDATTQGMKTAERLAAIVVKEGLGIVSGLAEGIDAAAERVAAYYAVPQVAVLGTGIRHVFPRSTAGLRRRIIAAGGAVMSEYLPYEQYGKSNFVQRNRIQAGLAAAVCPVEGRDKGGTAHTVKFAAQYGRPLFGVFRSSIPPTNELVAALERRGQPVFDLDAETGVNELHAYLRAIGGPRVAVPQRPAPERLFRDVVRARRIGAGCRDLPV